MSQYGHLGKIQDDIVKDLFEKIKDITSNIIHPNIIVAGKTGVGKSTLINSVFRADLADTGTGKPVTEHLRKITHPDIPVTLYDTKGLELKEEVQKQIKTEIINVVNNSRKGEHAEDYIHVIWYCIQSGSNRIEETEIELIRELADAVEIPVILVVTQCLPNSQSARFITSIKEMNLKLTNIVPIMAQDYEIMEGTVIKASGLDQLVEITYNVLPESVQRGFINAQKVSIKAKEKAAKIYADNYIKGSFVTGFIPIPCADAPILVGEQVVMLAHITAIFGLPLDKVFLSTVVSSLLGGATTTLAGRFIVTNLLKMIPVVGMLVGGVISGTTAAILTASLARVYIAIMVKVVKAMNKGKTIGNQEIFDNLKENFSEELKKGRQTV